jgi:NosR/NirI family transcriptional regulator, nitrous oxide reductase regulator
MMRFISVVLLAVLAGGTIGFVAGPALSRLNATVAVAERVAREDREGLVERTLESEAFRNTGRTAAELYSDARRATDVFRFGFALVGVWCGLVVAARWQRAKRIPPQEKYEIDAGACVSCGRCFMSCPIERERLAKSSESGKCD